MSWHKKHSAKHHPAKRKDHFQSGSYKEGTDYVEYVRKADRAGAKKKTAKKKVAKKKVAKKKAAGGWKRGARGGQYRLNANGKKVYKKS